MAEALHIVNPETCNGDGICADVCPGNVLEVVNDTAGSVEQRVESCIYCGQCVAVCPTESLRMPRLEMEDFQRLKKPQFGYDEFYEFLRLRRSVRVFKDRPIERDVIEKVLEAAATAPMGFPPHTTEILVIESPEEREFLLTELVKRYDSMIKTFSNPVGRLMVRFSAGAEDFNMLEKHIVESARFANELYRRDGTDRYMYGAPVLMIFHGSRWGMSYQQNAHLVCHHAMLAAVSLGLGTTILGVIPPIVDQSKALRERYAIPKDNRILTSLILGYPKYRYRQGVRRDLAGVTYH